MSDDGENKGGKAGARKPFFSGGEGDPTSSYGGAGLGPGAQIGPYKVLGILGEGGYGIVYLAQQEKPIRRRVALKIIKPGMDSKQVIARFEAERQALALLDHPNIAHVYDAGTTGTGHPYFAMEYIEGISITDYCDREKLSIKDRLPPFLQVCDAVQYAHQKGIIHRDLKPSNILVSTEDGKPRPKIIDFGIAKALTQSLTDRTLYTEQGQFIGTPDYMSPEQAEQDAQRLDTRSDVYSLGVVLYELLTGVLPFDPEELRAGGVSHIRTVIQAQEPQTPSTRLTSLGEDVQKIAERRQTDAQTLARSLRRELEWIPLKAIRKESSRRYQSASELGEDIHNYLKGIPLLAGPESSLYRLRKFIKRRAGAVVAVTLVAVSLVLGLAVSTSMYLRSEKMRVDAEEARVAAQSAQTAEATQRKIAEDERDRAVKAEEEARRRLVDLYLEQGRRYMDLGDYDRAAVLLAEALRNDKARVSAYLLLQECLRKHPDPNLHVETSLLAWEEPPGHNASFVTSPDRKFAAFFDQASKTICVFDTKTAKLKARIDCGEITQLAFLPGNKFLVGNSKTPDGGNLVKVMDLEGGEVSASIARNEVSIDDIFEQVEDLPADRETVANTYQRILTDPRGEWFAFVEAMTSDEGLVSKLNLWDFAAAKLRTSPVFPTNQFISAIAFRPTSAGGHPPRVVTLDVHDNLLPWEAPTLVADPTFRWSALSGAFDSTGTKFISLDRSHNAVISHRSENRVIRAIRNTIAYGFSPNGQRVIAKQGDARPAAPGSGRTHSVVQLYSAENGEHLSTLATVEITNWCFSPNSAFVVTEHSDGSIRVWETERGELRSILQESGSVVTDISPDSHWVVSCRKDPPHTVMIHDLITQREYEPYEYSTPSTDLLRGWVIATSDHVFKYSCCAPKQLPRFNADGSCLIAPRGLQSFLPSAKSLEQTLSVIAAYVPYRLEDGLIRSASKEEMLRAKWYYASLSGSSSDNERAMYLVNLLTSRSNDPNLNEAWKMAEELSSLRNIDNPELLQRVHETVHQLSMTYLARGDLANRQRRYRAAIEMYDSALRTDPNNYKALSACAWFLATCPEHRFRDSTRAVVLAERACKLTNWANWEYMSIYATALAGAGDYDNAVKFQRKAIQLLPTNEQARFAANFQERLRRFQNRMAYDRTHFLNLPTEDLVGWWTFDTDDRTLIHDKSGNAGHGRVVGSMQLASGLTGRVLTCSGTTGAIYCQDDGIFNGAEAFSISVWIIADERPKEPEPEAEYAHSTIVRKGHSWSLRRYCTSGLIALKCGGLNVPSSDFSSVIMGTRSITDRFWHHIVAVYDGASLKLYIDNTLDTVAKATGAIAATTNPLVIGGDRPGSYVGPWKGVIDDVRLYNTALSSADIAELYRTGKENISRGLFVYSRALRNYASVGSRLQLEGSVLLPENRSGHDELQTTWEVSDGPGEVQFFANESTQSPKASFSEPGIYDLVFTAQVDDTNASYTMMVVVYPQDFDGLVAHYTFDQNTTADCTDHGLNGILRNGALIVMDSERDRVLALAENGAHMVVENSPRLQFTEALTIAAWMKARSFSEEWQTIVTKGDFGWVLQRYRGEETIRFTCAGLEGDIDQPDVVGKTKISDGLWHHLVATYDGSYLRLYIDGEPDGATAATGSFLINEETLCIGEIRGKPGHESNRCYIDDVRIYNRPLRAEEVARLYTTNLKHR